MKKLLNVVLVFQFLLVPVAVAMNSGLIPQNFTDEGMAVIQQRLSSGIRTVASGSTSADVLIADISGEYRNQLEGMRKMLNSEFSIRETSQYEEKVRRTIELEDEEINDLESRLSSLRQSSEVAADILKPFEKKISQNKNNIKEAREGIMQVEIPELFSEDQVTESTNDFSERLGEVREGIEGTQRNESIEDIIEKTCSKIRREYERSVSNLLSGIKRQYDFINKHLGSVYDSLMAAEKKTYENEKNNMQRILIEAESRIARLKQEHELYVRVQRVFRDNPSLKAEKIFVRAVSVQEKPIQEKRDITERLYEKFKLFSDLYGHSELGVKATKRDLANILKYVEDTKITVPKPKNELPQLSDIKWSASHRYSGYMVPYSEAQFLMNRYKMPNIFCRSDGDMAEILNTGGYGSASENRKMYVHFRDVENAKRSREGEKYTADVRRATAVDFPTESFDCLVDQFNEFINRL